MVLRHQSWPNLNIFYLIHTYIGFATNVMKTPKYTLKTFTSRYVIYVARKQLINLKHLATLTLIDE